MIKVLLTEYRRTVNIWLIFGILGVAFSICFDSWNDLIQGIENHSGYVHYYFWNSAFGGMCREHLLPVFAAFPFAASLCYERKSKAVDYIVSREGKKRYCVTKYVVNAISGGMVIAIGTAIVLLLLSTVLPMTNSDLVDAVSTDLFHDWLAVHHPMEYGMVEICLGFFRGIIWSSIALLVSVYINDPFVVTISPYVGHYAFAQFCRLLQIDNEYRLDMILIGRTVIQSSWNTVLIACITTMTIVAVIGIVFVRKVERGLQNAILY